MRVAGVAAMCMLLGVLAGAASARGVVTCTLARKSQLEAKADAYAKKMPAARAAYFKSHKAKAARAVFVAKQKAALAKLKNAAACDDSAPAPTGPAAAPPPSANEHFFFGDEISSAFRDEITGFATYAVQDEQTLFGVQFGEVNVFGSSNPAWLAQHECDFNGFGGDCVSQKTAYWTNTPGAEGGPKASFLYLGTGDLTNATASLKQKLVAHELFHVLQYQLDGLVQDGQTPLDQVRLSGPVWMLEGAAEMVGYRVMADRGFNFASYDASLVGEKIRARSVNVPLDQLLTVAQDRAAGNPYAVYMVALDHLVTIAPNGLRSLATYYTALGAGSAWQDAFASAFGMTVDAFYANFASYRAGL